MYADNASKPMSLGLRDIIDSRIPCFPCILFTNFSFALCLTVATLRTVWRTMNCILGRKRSSKLPRNSPSAQQFLDIFNEKVAAAHRSTASGTAQSTLPAARVTFDTFDYCTEDDVQRAITGAASSHALLTRCPPLFLKSFCRSSCHS